MLPWSDIVDNISTTAFAAEGATFAGGTTQLQIVIWEALFRHGENSVDEKLLFMAIGRYRSTIYLRGFKENITIATNTAQHWRWRRVVFGVPDNFLGDSANPENG